MSELPQPAAQPQIAAPPLADSVPDRTVARTWVEGSPSGGATGAPPPLPVAPMGEALPAGLGSRLAANLLDSLVVFVFLAVVVYLPALLLGVLSGRRSGVATAILGVLVVAAYGMAFAYSLVPLGRLGQTIGKRVMGVRVVDRTTGGPIGVGRSFLRGVGLWLMGLPCDLGYLSILLDKSGYHRGWHDGLAGSVVVAVPSQPFGSAVRDVLATLRPGWTEPRG